MLLKEREPMRAEYEALLKLSPDQQTARLNEAIDQALQSKEFYEQAMAWGQDYLRIGMYQAGTDEGTPGFWNGSQSGELHTCPQGTVHAGAYGLFNDRDGMAYGGDGYGDSIKLCASPTAAINEVEPWWAPGTMVRVIGRAGTGKRTHNGKDCGSVIINGAGYFPDDRENLGCSCGPNLIYCLNQKMVKGPYADEHRDGIPHIADSQRRLMWEEPARLLAHIVREDRPFSDLVLGDYTVAPRRLQYAYARSARQNSENRSHDDSDWWRRADDTWKEVKVSQIQPNLISDRTYKFDPRTDPGKPLGTPAAGVLTMLVSNQTFPRERVRAARWLESLACVVFDSPPAGTKFPPFKRDPATEGSCSYCHTKLEPAAIHFKRFHIRLSGESMMGGVDRSWERTEDFFSDLFPRLKASFIPNTFLTPVDEATLMARPDSRFIDFLPPDKTLFNTHSDGTIGPLGFGKLIVESGEFDKCAVIRIHERFTGRKLSKDTDADRVRKLVEVFKSQDRKVKPKE